jgi:hypothetical protein
MRARFSILFLPLALIIACSAPVPSSSSSSGDVTGSKRKSKEPASDDSDESIPADKKRSNGNNDDTPLEPSNNAPRTDAGTPSTPRPPADESDRPAGSSSSSTGGAPTCDRDANCSLGSICQRGVCELGCRGNADCPTNEHCDVNRGQCAAGSPVSQGNQCVIDENCPLGRICENGRCILGCRSSFDCPLNQSCIVGFCF